MYWDRFDIVDAHYWFCVHYHGGQSSELYARLSRISGYYRPAPSLSGPDTENARAIYDALVIAHGFAKYRVYYEIVTPESAAHGDADERGDVLQTNDLREAIDALQGTRTNLVDGLEAVEWSASELSPRDWITVVNGQEFETGAHESRTLHFSGVTVSSMKRVARLVGLR